MRNLLIPMLMTTWSVSCAQDVPPPPKPQDDSPNLEFTMKYIQEKPNRIRLRYSVDNPETDRELAESGAELHRLSAAADCDIARIGHPELPRCPDSRPAPNPEAETVTKSSLLLYDKNQNRRHHRINRSRTGILLITTTKDHHFATYLARECSIPPVRIGIADEHWRNAVVT
jgi:hypothetical protein